MTRTDLAGETLLGETILNRGGTTEVPEAVMETLCLRPKPGERSKLQWTLAGEGATVTKGTAQSDWRKTMIRKNGTASVPRYIQQALKLSDSSRNEEKLLWMRKGGQIVIKKRTHE